VTDRQMSTTAYTAPAQHHVAMKMKINKHEKWVVNI